MKGFVKGLSLFIAVTCLVWLAVIWRWNATSRDMSTYDIVMYLVLLPLLMFMLVAASLWAYKGFQEKAKAKAENPEASSSASTQSQPKPLTESEKSRRQTFQLISGRAMTSAGSSVEAIEGAAKNGDPVPKLLDDLLDEGGMPVMAAKSEDIELSVYDDQIQPKIESVLKDVIATKPEWSNEEPDQAFKRALIMLHQVLEQNFTDLAPWTQHLAKTNTGSNSSAAQQATGPRLRILTHWPSSFSAFEKALANGWLKDAVLGAELPVLASFMSTDTPDPQHDGLMESGIGLWHTADALFKQMETQQRHDLIMLLTCESLVSEAKVGQLETQNRLYTTTNKLGLMPGEGAAGLILADSSWVAPEDVSPLPAMVHRPTIVKRDKSIEAAGKVTPDVVMNAVDMALQGSEVASAEFASLITDADTHTPRGQEVFLTSGSRFAHMEANEEVLSTGITTGAINAVSCLMVVAMAANKAASSEKPVMALSVFDTHWRMATVAKPQLPPNPSSST